MQNNSLPRRCGGRTVEKEKNNNWIKVFEICLLFFSHHPRKALTAQLDWKRRNSREFYKLTFSSKYYFNWFLELTLKKAAESFRGKNDFLFKERVSWKTELITSIFSQNPTMNPILWAYHIKSYKNYPKINFQSPQNDKLLLLPHVVFLIDFH